MFNDYILYSENFIGFIFNEINCVKVKKFFILELSKSDMI